MDCKRNHPDTSMLLNSEQANGKQQAKNNRSITSFKFAKWKVCKRQIIFLSNGWENSKGPKLPRPVLTETCILMLATDTYLENPQVPVQNCVAICFSPDFRVFQNKNKTESSESTVFTIKILIFLFPFRMKVSKLFRLVSFELVVSVYSWTLQC